MRSTLGNTNPGPWTESENTILLDAIERYRLEKLIINIVSEQTGRSQKSIKRRLIKIGFLNRFGRPFSKAYGHSI